MIQVAFTTYYMNLVIHAVWDMLPEKYAPPSNGLLLGKELTPLSNARLQWLLTLVHVPRLREVI